MTRRPSLSGPRHFRRVRSAGLRSSAGVIIAYAHPAPPDREGRTGLAVAGRGIPAVRRNRVRRRVRAALQWTQVPDYLDLVVSARPDAESRPFQLLVADVGRAVGSACGRAGR